MCETCVPAHTHVPIYIYFARNHLRTNKISQKNWKEPRNKFTLQIPPVADCRRSRSFKYLIHMNLDENEFLIINYINVSLTKMLEIEHSKYEWSRDCELVLLVGCSMGCVFTWW